MVRFNDGGVVPEYEGEDYGVYQIYGRHILGDRDALLYIGEATDQTFSARLRQHQSWLAHEYPVRVYVGRIYDPRRHSRRDQWDTWKADVLLAERVLIYTYSPHYNASSITERPFLHCNRKVRVINEGDRHRLRRSNTVPDDWD
jgi:hypothetical protein